MADETTDEAVAEVPEPAPVEAETPKPKPKRARGRGKPKNRVERFLMTAPGGARVQVVRDIDTGEQTVEQL